MPHVVFNVKHLLTSDLEGYYKNKFFLSTYLRTIMTTQSVLLWIMETLKVKPHH